MQSKNEKTSLEMYTSLKKIYDEIIKGGDDPIQQLSGYILSEDPTYIPASGEARHEMRTLDRDEILAELISSYFKTNQ